MTIFTYQGFFTCQCDTDCCTCTQPTAASKSWYIKSSYLCKSEFQIFSSRTGMDCCATILVMPNLIDGVPRISQLVTNMVTTFLTVTLKLTMMGFPSITTCAYDGTIIKVWLPTIYYARNRLLIVFTRYLSECSHKATWSSTMHLLIQQVFNVYSCHVCPGGCKSPRIYPN